MGLIIQIPHSVMVETQKAFGTNFVSKHRGWVTTMRWLPKSATGEWHDVYIDKDGVFFGKGEKFTTVDIPEWLVDDKFKDGYEFDGVMFDPSQPGAERYDVRLMEGVEKCGSR